MIAYTNVVNDILITPVWVGTIWGRWGRLSRRPGGRTHAISATNVTMPSSGNGAIPYVLTSVDGYTGTITVSCPEVNAPAGAKIPYCGSGPIFAVNLTPAEAFRGKLALTPYGVPVPAAAAALLAGLAFRMRRKTGWPTSGLAVACTLAFLGVATGCGSGTSGMTQGTYAYTVTATDINTNAHVSTTVNVTVP